MQTQKTSHKIPDNIAELQSLVQTLLADIANKDTEIELLRHKLQAQLAARFASKSEKHKGQIDLFDEATLPEQAEVVSIENADEEITIAAHTRKKVGRKPLPKNLPREQIVHDLTEAEKTCSCGCQMHKIGEDKFLVRKKILFLMLFLNLYMLILQMAKPHQLSKILPFFYL